MILPHPVQASQSPFSLIPPAPSHLKAGDFGLYVHWPFCRSKCPYCDFNSHVRQSVDHKRWRHALLKELTTFSQRMRGNRLVSLFFGGGTPSLMDPDTVADIIATATSLFEPPIPLEITLEANPTQTEADLFSAFAQAGVNRLSMGIQSLRDEGLALLGRTYTAAQAHKAMEQAKACFSTVSFDLMFLYQGHTYSLWQQELDEILVHHPQHLSAYQLMYAPGTLFHRKLAQGYMAQPLPAESSQFQKWTHNRLEAAGFKHYEISNYAQAGYESRHNCVYWNSLPFLGIGPGAHGRYWEDDIKIAYKTWSLPEKWLQAVENNHHGQEQSENLTPHACCLEWLIMGLRLTQGLDLKRCLSETGFPFEAWMPSEHLFKLEHEGFCQVTETHLCLTPQGLEVLDEVLRYLAQHLRVHPQI